MGTEVGNGENTEPRPDFGGGVGVALAGAAVLFVAVFLPMADSSQFGGIAENSLIQHGYGWFAVVLGVGAAIFAYQSLGGHRRPRMLMVIGIGAIALSIAWANNDELLTLKSAASTDGLGLGEALDVLSSTEKAAPGIGIYAVGLGGLLIAAGGYMLRQPASEAAD